MNFCSEYIELNKGTEIPPMFTAWCSLSAVAVALGRRVWIDMGPFKIYPNMFVVLVAGSGKERKSTAIGVTKGLLENLFPPPNLVCERFSPEFLIEALKDYHGNQTKVSVGDPTSVYIPTGQGVLIADEFTSIVNNMTHDRGISEMLIKLYDCGSTYGYGTKTRGKEYLKDVQLNLLAGTTPEALRKAVPEEAIGSGLSSRILFVYEDRPAPPIAFPAYSSRQLSAQEFCLKSLQRIYAFSGPIKLPQDSIDWGRECYEKRCYNSKLYSDPYLSGYASRRFVHILKLSICLAAGMKESLEITPRILNSAEEMIESNEHNLQRVIKLVTMNEKGGLSHWVLGIIGKAGRISKPELLTILSNRIDNRELIEIIETLRVSEQVVVLSNGGTIYYQIKGVKE